MSPRHTVASDGVAIIGVPALYNIHDKDHDLEGKIYGPLDKIY